MKHIDKVFGDQLRGHSVDVPEGLWDRLEGSMDEKPTRGVIWYWMAGLCMLLISTSTYLYVVNYETAIVDESLATHMTKDQISITANKRQKVKTTNDNNQDVSTITEQYYVKEQPKAEPVANLESNTRRASSINRNRNIHTIAPLPSEKTSINTQGKPANLTITKSYISDAGSVITQEELNTEENAPKYDVLINASSEAVHAGTLLRIIQPPAEITLPAFVKPLKKK